MKLFESTQNMLVELSEIVENLKAEEYVQPAYYLSNSTIGQHVRHTVELFQCLLKGYETGEVNYDLRKRDIQIETDQQLAVNLLKKVITELNKADKPMNLIANYSSVENDEQVIPTNYFRELAYNLEHTVHHMALIKVGLMEVSSVKPSAEFGVASSTIRYRNECAQ
jgi:hypothetical protein